MNTGLRQQNMMAFNAIVTIVGNRAGLDYSRAFNRVLVANRDLLTESGNACDLGELHLLHGRADEIGLSGKRLRENVASKIGRLVNRFSPGLGNAPVELQWNVLWRAAKVLESDGIGKKLFNRPSNSDVSPTDWDTANDRAGTVLSLLEEKEEKSHDFGASEYFQKMHPTGKAQSFRVQIARLVKDDGLTIAEAFAKLKVTQPIFWAHGILSFEPGKP